jgi:hypothetical protein
MRKIRDRQTYGYRSPEIAMAFRANNGERIAKSRCALRILLVGNSEFVSRVIRSPVALERDVNFTLLLKSADWTINRSCTRACRRLHTRLLPACKKRKTERGWERGRKGRDRESFPRTRDAFCRFASSSPKNDLHVPRVRSALSTISGHLSVYNVKISDNTQMTRLFHGCTFSTNAFIDTR